MTPTLACVRRRLAMAGNPNSGKTTLFNRLTGLRQKVANYAGVTVEHKTGIWTIGDQEFELIDLPGTYSLSPASEEERVAAEVILGRHDDEGPVHGVLLVLDGTTLEKSLFFALQLRDSRMPCALLLNMADELAQRGAQLDTDELSRRLNMPVFLISATHGQGLEALAEWVSRWSAASSPIEHPFIPLPTIEEITVRRTEARSITQAVLKVRPQRSVWSDRIDRVMLHRVWGPLIFSIVVLLVFQAIFSWAQPLMDLTSGVFDAAASAVRQNLPDSWMTRLLADGILAGVGAVVIFLPQILIVFFFLAILEQTGYLARAALVMDQMLHKIGLQGKSFLPLISSYACAIPGIMATRTIENRRDRLATIFVAPFMTCSARLPVYALLISAFIPNKPVLGSFLSWRALTLLGLYVLGFAAALMTAWLLKSSILKSDRVPFFLEMPPYRWPNWHNTFLTMWDRAKAFLQRAGTIILAASVVLWVLASFPRVIGPTGHPDIEQSIAGRIGHFIEPAISPLGFNWKIGIGLVSAQAAREVMVSALSTIYHVQSKDDTASLQQALRTDLTPLTAISLLIFFALALQCSSTLAIARRETGSWRIPVTMFVYMNTLAYLASLLVYQGGRFLGWG